MRLSFQKPVLAGGESNPLCELKKIRYFREVKNVLENSDYNF
jgi:hypothetical protein